MKINLGIVAIALAFLTAGVILGPKPRTQLYRVGDEPVVADLRDWIFPSLPRPTPTPGQGMPQAHKIRRPLTLDQEREIYETFKRESAAKYATMQLPPPMHGPPETRLAHPDAQ